MTATTIYISTLLVKNIHCPSCVAYARDVLQHLPAIRRIDVSIIDHRLTVEHQGDITREITEALLKAAFEVDHVTVTDTSGYQVRSYTVHHDPVQPRFSIPYTRAFMSKAHRRHVENCNACREERKGMKPVRTVWTGWAKRRRLMRSLSQSTDIESVQDRSTRDAATPRAGPAASDGFEEEARSRGLCSISILVGGMTCGSCVSTITKGLERLPGVDSVNVNLVANNARITFRESACTSEELIEAIEDMGFEAQIQEVHSPTREEDNQAVYTTKISVEGMTCGSCTGSISRGLQEFSFVESVNVDLLSNNATVTFRGKDNIDVIAEKIEDLGYDALVASVEQQTKVDASSKDQKRKVQIQVSGMYCSKCPINITTSLQQAYPHDLTITHKPSLSSPVMTIVYTPALPTLTIRTIIGSINSVDPACTASVYHAPSLEERSQRIQRRERNRTLRHLLLTFLVAIPTFVIGVVYMSLVPGSNSTRQWLEAPMWVGFATRMDWAMFVMTTPVMFYGANVFHSRALKEIWSLWKPGSKVPILRRFYRFGSMNLLISAGTSVAYFSSLAVLIMDATSNRMEESQEQNLAQMNQRKSVTYFDTVTFLTFFILIGRFLEAYSKAKTGNAVSMLSNLRPTDALLVETTQSDIVQIEKSVMSRVSVDLLEIGDVVSVPHGACPPTDGTICQEGTFIFDESSFTGESRPVKKSQGDPLYTGTVNVSSPVRMEVTERQGKTMLDQIVNVVREGQAKRAPVERLADIFTGYFTPVITLLAISTWVVWLALGESGALPQSWLDVRRGGWVFWSVEFAIAVFVIACPCGIGLAAPTALFVGGGLAAKHGILVQGGGEAFQEASRLNTIVFDKTGTLTEGKMRVTTFESIGNFRNQEEQTIQMVLAKALEESSSHPIAKAIVDYCTNVTKPSSTQIRSADVKEVPGQGMTGTFQVQTATGSRMYEAVIGNERLLHSSATTPTWASNLQDLEKHEAFQSCHETANSVLDAIMTRFQMMGCSTAILALRPKVEVDDRSDQPFRPVAVFAITDPIRPEAREILSSLRSRKIAVHMCTGDNRTTAHAIASQLDIPVANVRAGVMPEDKATYIKELQYPDSIHTANESTHTANTKSIRKIVAFVGDGTNDTPALAVSDVSIAISHPSSSDIALSSSSFILLNSSLNSILSLVTLSRRVFTRVKFNFLWAGIYNLVLIPVAAGVFFPLGANNDHGGFRLSPVWASLAMAASSVSVVLSSLALRLPEFRFRGVIDWIMGRKKT